MQTREYNSILDKARRYCSKQESCRKDLAKKLQDWDMDEEHIEKALEQLTQEKFLDESRYSRAVVNDKIRFNKWGRIKVHYFLRQHGIAEGLIQEALGSYDDKEYVKMVRTELNQKDKHTSSSGPWDRKAKLYRFAQSRGYETEIVMKFLGNSGEVDI